MKKVLALTTLVLLTAQSSFAARLVCEVAKLGEEPQTIDLKLEDKAEGQSLHLGDIGETSVNVYFMFTSDPLKALANPWLNVTATAKDGTKYTGIQYPRSKSALNIRVASGEFIDASCERIVEAGDPVGQLPSMPSRPSIKF